MAIATTPLEVVSLAEMKSELRLPSTENSLDTLISGLIASAVRSVADITDRPLVARPHVHVLERFPPENCPIRLPYQFVSSADRIVYRTPTDSLRTAGTGMIPAADLGVMERRPDGDGFDLYWPEDGWPEILPRSRPQVMLTMGWDAGGAAALAVKLMVRDAFDGRTEIRGTPAADRILEPYLPYGHIAGAQ